MGYNFGTDYGAESFYDQGFKAGQKNMKFN